MAKGNLPGARLCGETQRPKASLAVVTNRGRQVEAIIRQVEVPRQAPIL